jgi:exopolysaccharide biosynthesis polyprenyl glycosylphosphotransferase
MLLRLCLALILFIATFAMMHLLVIPALARPNRGWGFLYFVTLYAGIVFIIIFALRELIHLVEVRFLRSLRVVRIAFIRWSFRLNKALKGLLNETLLNGTIVGFISDHIEDQQPPTESGYLELGRLENLSAILTKQEITSLIVDQQSIAFDELLRIELVCSDLMISLNIIPWSFGVWTDRQIIQFVDGVPLFRVKTLLHDRSPSKLFRRFIDIVGSLVGLIISTPIIVILAIFIKKESPGPVFYRQNRVGLHKKTFQLIKLRSMRPDAEEEYKAGWTVANDPRRLKIGEFMRKWNLDELPQFWNVLKGEMSLVGPRPERPEFVEMFRQNMHYYNLRHSCKPGTTGWAAVHGLRGDTSIVDRLAYDLYYIENWSPILDFKIMLMTLISQKNAY